MDESEDEEPEGGGMAGMDEIWNLWARVFLPGLGDKNEDVDRIETEEGEVIEFGESG